MADLTGAATTADPCCAPAQQAGCCEPSAKSDCCGHDEGCGCAAGSEPMQPSDVHEQPRERLMPLPSQVMSTDFGAERDVRRR